MQIESSLMIKLWVILLMAACVTSTHAQRVFSVLEEPRFGTAEDSIRYEAVNLAFRKALEQKVSPSDSLLKEFQLLRMRITGYRRQYKSSAGFITLDSLKHIQDKSKVKLLSITKWKASKMPREVYECTGLTELELVDTRIRKIKSLKKLPALWAIYVLNNKPKQKFALSKSKTVRTFVMRGNTPALPKSFASFKALERLDLAANGITSFPAGLSTNKNLKQLTLNNNAIKDLTTIPLLPALEKLELIRNKIEFIPKAIGNLSGLKQLTLNHNLITTVDVSIGQLKKLEQLSFYQNRLTSIPEGVYALEALQEIDLYHNEIERVDERITDLRKLEILYLSHNKILSLPSTLGTITSLKELYLSDNRLVELPALNQLNNLKVLRINNNRLVQFPVILTNLKQLENLDISGNQLSEIPNGLNDLQALKLLVLMNNPWDEPSRNAIPAVTRSLRSKGVLVHVEERLVE